MRIFVGGEPSGLAFFVQVKSALSLARFTLRDRETVSFPFSAKKLRQWATTSLPVILVLWDAESDELLWSPLDRDRVRTVHTATSRVRFDRRRTLDGSALPILKELVESEAAALTNEREAAAALIELLSESKGGVHIDYDAGGVIFEELDDGGALIHFFGEMLPVVEALARETGLPPHDAVLKALEEAISRHAP